MMLYYDRAGNNYRKMGADTASQLKHAIEFDSNEHPTGWSVQLMSIGQGNIGQGDEYIFMQELLAGHNKYLPRCLPVQTAQGFARKCSDTGLER